MWINLSVLENRFEIHVIIESDSFNHNRWMFEERTPSDYLDGGQAAALSFFVFFLII